MPLLLKPLRPRRGGQPWAFPAAIRYLVGRKAEVSLWNGWVKSQLRLCTEGSFQRDLLRPAKAINLKALATQTQYFSIPFREGGTSGCF